MGMPTREALAVPESSPNRVFKTFGWRLLFVPTIDGHVTSDVTKIKFVTTDGILVENENCTPVGGNWYNYPNTWVHALGPEWAFYHEGPLASTRWVGVQDGNKEVWAGLQCTVEQAELQAVIYEENPGACSWQTNAHVGFLSAWSGSEWLEVAQVKLRCDGPLNPCSCGGEHVIWNATKSFKVPISF